MKNRIQPAWLISMLILILTAGCAPQVQMTPTAVFVQPTEAFSPTPEDFSTTEAVSTSTSEPSPEIPISGQLTETVPALEVKPETPQAATGCISPASLTPPMTEGPYFKAGSPETTSLYQPGIPGKRLHLSGYVLYPDCSPAANALIEFWQTDGEGRYDNQGYTLRGHQFTDASGRYQLETVVPGLYPGRTEHIHVKVQVPGGEVLTSQLFFPDVSQNSQDRIFAPELLVTIQQDTDDSMTATFNFIVAKP